jgi:hypothetical protein
LHSATGRLEQYVQATVSEGRFSGQRSPVCAIC